MGIYSGVEAHRKMNFDGIRNPVYQRAICDAVTPNSVVLDLGAGLGMHGFIAAKAGARKVYLVEPEPVIEVTRKIAAANGLTNIECIQATAETVKLDEQADLIVSVFTGNFLLTEDLLPSLFHARDHLLAPGGRMIPDRARMMVAPVSAADYYRENVANGSSAGTASDDIHAIEIDYREMRPYLANAMHYDLSEKFGAQLLAPPACLLDLDFMTAEKAECDSTVEFIANESGECHGWLGWFDMRLGTQWLSTAPDAAATHWRQVFMPLDQPLNVEPGQTLGFSLKRPEFGEWTWTTDFDGRQQRQSTFLSQPITPEMMRQKSESFQPQLNDRGEAMKFVLSHFNGNASTGFLADELLQRFADTFTSREAALRFVKAQANKFS